MGVESSMIWAWSYAKQYSDGRGLTFEALSTKLKFWDGVGRQQIYSCKYMPTSTSSLPGTGSKRKRASPTTRHNLVGQPHADATTRQEGLL